MAGLSPYTIRYHERRARIDLRGHAIRRLFSALGLTVTPAPTLGYFWTPLRAHHGVWHETPRTATQSGPRRAWATCGAKTRAGLPCRSRQLYGNGRCLNHGGASTGPRTDEGKARIAAANRKRSTKP